MLKQNDEFSPHATPSALRLAGQRLRDARYILLASAGALGAAWVAGALDPGAGITIYVAIVAASALPRRSRTMRLAERRRADIADMGWHKAIELPLAAIDEPVYLLRADGTVKFQNQAAKERFGTSEPDAHLSVRVRSPAIGHLVQQAVEDGRAEVIEHVERVPAERWYQVRCAPISGTPAIDAKGRLFLLTFRDMSEAKRMDRMRTDFVANASHELRTPLASLTGFIETLKGPARNDGVARERFLDIMYDQAQRMTRLVDDLMSLSRLEMKAHVAPTDTVDIAYLLRNLCGSMRPLADELGVVIDTSITEQPVMVRGDRDELIQVFSNLIENALKYGQSGKKIDVTLEIEAEGGPRGAVQSDGGSTVQVTVADHGPGIAPEHVPRLTERFYRVDIESSRSKKGTGLGLAIVKHILTRHRTRLLVKSKVGEGSRFIVRFERARRDRELST